MQWNYNWDEYQIFEAFCADILDNAKPPSSSSEHIAFVMRSQTLVSLIDTLSVVISGVDAPNGVRFRNILDNYCDWPNASKVSTHHLQKLLSYTSEPAFEPVKTYLQSFTFEPGALVRTAGQDPEYAVVASHFPKDSAGKPQKITFTPVPGGATMRPVTLEHLKHSGLFWMFRNAVVHNFKAPGGTTPFPTTYDEPIYHMQTLIESDGNGGTIETSTTRMNYPMAFLEKIATNAARNVVQHCRDNAIDPLASLQSDTYWLAQLNS